jgi:signal peptidase I
MEILDFFKEIFQTVILALLIVLPIRLFIFQPFIVKGQSMEPNFEDGDYLIIDEITYRFREPKRGEVVVFKNPMNERQRFIKRIVGLPGETVEISDGKIFISNGEKKVLNEPYLNYSFTFGDIKITLGSDEFFVLGDNRQFSLDSRRFGPIKKKEIVGRVLLRLWPIYSFAKIEAPAY